MAKKDFLKLIETQRGSKKHIKFEGTFLDYLDKISKNPDIVKLAHKRLYDVLEGFGVCVMDETDPRHHKLFDGENIKIFDYFQKEFFGMETIIAKIMRFLKSASMRGEECRQVLLFMGPVGAGKSALTEYIKRALEGEKYYHLKDDPQCGEPLHLLPRALRLKFEKMLNVKIEGDLSPIARHSLLHEFGGEYENFPIVEATFSQRGRRGIVSVPPMDANSQDVSVLIGSEDISKIRSLSGR